MNIVGQASRPISTSKLKALQPVHIRPINHVIYMESLVRLSAEGKSYLRGGLALRCFQCLSFRDIATQLTHLAARLEHQRSIIPGPLVLGNAPFKFPTPAADRDRTVSRRSEPSSRTTLTGEQTDPWELLHPQDVMSRHRGAKPRRRYELLDAISLLSPEYLLSVERRLYH